jgi:YHS domain-containing protein
MIKASELLDFQPLEQSDPDYICQVCGAHTRRHDQRMMATITPFHNSTDTVMYVVCSERCKEKFVNHPQVMVMILGTCSRIAEATDTTLSEEYLEYERQLAKSFDHQQQLN